MKKTLRMPSAFLLGLTANWVTPPSPDIDCMSYSFYFHIHVTKRVSEAIVSQEKLFVDMRYWNGNTYTYQFDGNAKIKTKHDTEIIVHKSSLCVSTNVELITSRKSNTIEFQEMKRHRQKRIKEKRLDISSRYIKQMKKSVCFSEEWSTVVCDYVQFSINRAIEAAVCIILQMILL